MYGGIIIMVSQYIQDLYIISLKLQINVLNFKMIGLKQIVLGRIARNFILYHCVKEIKNFEQHRNFLSDMHQNLISTKLYQGATEYKVSSIYAH